jgi:hypothetical protein
MLGSIFTASDLVRSPITYQTPGSGWCAVVSEREGCPPRPRVAPAAAPRPGPGRAGLPHKRGNLCGIGADYGGHRAHGELLGQAEIHPGEFQRDQSLAQLTHGRQQLGRGVRQQRGQPLRQRQPTAEPLQVTVCLGHHQIPHRCPFLAPIMTCRSGPTDPVTRITQPGPGLTGAKWGATNDLRGATRGLVECSKCTLELVSSHSEPY